MNKPNLDYFKRLLKIIMEDSTVPEFSKKTGISAQHIRRLLKDDYKGVPSTDTLDRIHSVSYGRVDLKKLYESCGYDFEESNSKNKNINLDGRDLIYQKAYFIQNHLNEAIEHIRGWSNLDYFIHYIKSWFYNDNIEINIIEKDKKYTDAGNVGIEKYSIFNAIFEDNEVIITVYFALTHSYTEGKKMIIFNSIFDYKSLRELEGVPKNILIPYLEDNNNNKIINSLPYLYKLEEKYNLVKKYNSFMTTGSDFIEYAKFLGGYGFYLENEVDEDLLKDFLIENKDYFLTKQTERYYTDAFVNGNAVLDVFKKFNVGNAYGKGVYASVAYIMKKKTGFDFEFYQKEGVFDDTFKNHSCIMCISDNTINNKSLLSSIRSFANDLGIIKYGKCFYQIKDTFDASEQYFTDNNEGL